MELDNTKASCFRTCKRKYYWQHVQGLQSNYGSSAIRYGVCWHGMMEGYYSYIAENGWSNKERAIHAALQLGREKWDKETEKKNFLPDYRTFDSCCKAFMHYLSFYSKDEEFLKIVATETRFRCGIFPASYQEENLLKDIQEGLIFTGRLDLQIEMNLSNWILDFKTTGQSLSVQGARLNKSGQLMGYSYAGKEVLDFRAEGCLVSLAYVSAYKSKKTGEYGDVSTDFARIPQIYSEKDLDNWKASFIDTAWGIRRCENENWWPVNYDSCYQYGACGYTRLCNQNSFPDVITEGYHVDHWDVMKED